MIYDYDKRLKVFYDKRVPIHIQTKKGEWLNGYVTEIGSTFFTIDEFKKGYFLIFIDDLISLETYTKEYK